MKLHRKATVFCATWNNGNAAPPADLSPWLPKEGYDVYAIGAQECGYPPREGYETCEDDWNGTLANHFGEDYVPLVAFCITPQVLDKIPESETARLKHLLKNQTLEAVAELKIAEKAELVAPGEIRIAIFIKNSLRPHISAVTSSIQTTGRLGGLSGNKGGLSVSFKIGESRLAFFNAHLNAHTEHLVRRNQDTFSIFRGIKGSIPGFEPTQAHYCFFFGDLNYRVTLEHQETVDLIAQRNWERLLGHDQLLEQQAKSLVLANFKEPPIRFSPTFKVKRDQPLVYSTERVPSYCDRILYKTYPGVKISSDFYHSIEYFKTSDHKPVHAHFNIDYLPVLDLPPSLELIKEIVITDLTAIDLKTQDIAKPQARVVACLTWGSKTLFASTSPTTKHHWKEALRLNTSDVPLTLFKNAYLLLGVRDGEGETTVMLGEAVIPLAAVIATPVNFTLDLFQFALPCGSLSGKVTAILSEGTA